MNEQSSSFLVFAYLLVPVLEHYLNRLKNALSQSINISMAL